MVAKRSTKLGKIMPYIDVRSKSDIPKFESMIQMGPTIVLVYADWCGHCTRFKQNMWDEVAKSNMKGKNTAAVHYDMVENTSMNSTPIEGYPTLFEVKKTPAKQNISTPVSTPQNKEELEKLVGTELNENMKRGERMMTNSTIATQNTFTPEPVESLPPDITEDEVIPQKTVQSAVQAGGSKGGSLLESLLKVSADAAHAVVLTGSAIEISRRLKKRKHTKRRRSSTKQTRRR